MKVAYRYCGLQALLDLSFINLSSSSQELIPFVQGLPFQFVGRKHSSAYREIPMFEEFQNGNYV